MNRIFQGLKHRVQAAGTRKFPIFAVTGVAGVSAGAWLARPRAAGFGGGDFSVGFGRPDSIVQGIIAANAGVIAAWLAGEYMQLPRLSTFMARHFMTSVPAVQSGRWHTMLTSAYSHQGLLHIAFNMMALNSFAPSVLEGYNGVQRHVSAPP
jgi:hypothetical protein